MLPVPTELATSPDVRCEDAQRIAVRDEKNHVRYLLPTNGVDERLTTLGHVHHGLAITARSDRNVQRVLGPDFPVGVARLALQRRPKVSLP